MHRILLVDDHAIVREGFKRLFDGLDDFAVAAEAANPADALSAAMAVQPDLAVVDLSLGGGASGLPLLRELAAAVPAMQCVMLSMHDDPGLVVRALENGARGYVTKAVAPDELPSLLRRVVAGEIALSSDLAPWVSARPPAANLSVREREILRSLLSGEPPKAIALDLGISDKTLYRHRANLMEKLGARTHGDLARIARERGLLLQA